VNLIGEHIDYLGFPVLAIAMNRHVSLDAAARPDSVVRVASAEYGVRSFEWTQNLANYATAAGQAGDFGNYAVAAARVVATKWGVGPGVDGLITSTLSAECGFGSSAALTIAVTLALLEARGIAPKFSELMEAMAGGTEHAVCLAGRRDCATRVSLGPLRMEPEPIPGEWAFFLAHCLRRVEKSGAAWDEFRTRRQLALRGDPEALRHALGERARVEDAVYAMRRLDVDEFGRILYDSHCSLRDYLKVSCEAADRVVEACRAAGACGARIAGTGFGGYVLAVCERKQLEETMARLERDYFGGRAKRLEFPDYLMRVEAGPGALRPLDS
jgi:galactokinase